MALNHDKISDRSIGKTSNGDLNDEASAAATFNIILEISNLLNTGLDAEELLLCTKLIESGINPTALAFVVNNLKHQNLENSNEVT